jgi:hypothetical protein
MKLATMSDHEALISKLSSCIIRKRLNAMIWDASIQEIRPSVETELPVITVSRSTTETSINGANCAFSSPN